MILNDANSEVANDNRGAARVFGGGARTITACLRGALPLPKRNGGGVIGSVVASRKGSEINKLFVRKMCKMRVIFVRKMWNWLINGCFAKI